MHLIANSNYLCMSKSILLFSATFQMIYFSYRYKIFFITITCILKKPNYIPNIGYFALNI